MIKTDLFLKNNLSNIQERLKKVCQNTGRSLKSVSLLAVSKFHTVEAIEAAYALGLRDFAENYAQELKKKAETLKHLKDLRWHLIGPIQSNKIKYLNDSLFCFSALNSLSLAEMIESKSPRSIPLDVLIQLQVDKSDINKSGISYEEAKELCLYVEKSNKMQLKGFLGIGPDNTEDNKLRELYRDFVKKSYGLWAHCNKISSKFPVISLGMSDDLELAIECGSTQLRIGKSLFGERVN